MSASVRKSHNVSALTYHLVRRAKCHRAVFDSAVDEVLRDVCLEITARHGITFLEIGADLQPDADRADRQEHHGQGTLPPRAFGQEATVGRVLLIERLPH